MGGGQVTLGDSPRSRFSFSIKQTIEQVGIVKQFMARDPTELRFTVVSFGPAIEEEEDEG